MCGNNSKTTKEFSQQHSAQQYTADPVIQSGAYAAISKALALSNQPYNVPTRQIAGLNKDQNTAIKNIRSNQGVAQPYYDKAAMYADRGADPITAANLNVNDYLNPYANYALQALNRNIGINNRDLRGNMIRTAGGTGADRIALREARKFGEDQLARGQLMAGFYTPALQTALQVATGNRSRDQAAGYQFAGLGNTVQDSRMKDVNALLTSGALQQGNTQAGYDAAYQAALANLDAPWKQNQYLTSTVAGLAPALGGTTTGDTTKFGESTQTTKQSPVSQAIGAAMTIAGLATGNPMMAMGGKGSMGGSAGLGGMTGMGNPNIPAFTFGPESTGGAMFSNPLGMRQSMPWWANGGRVYARGGTVNPWSIAEGYDDGGEAFFDPGLPIGDIGEPPGYLDRVDPDFAQDFAGRLRGHGENLIKAWNGNYQNIHGPAAFQDPEPPSNPFSVMPPLRPRPALPASATAFDATPVQAPALRQNPMATPPLSTRELADRVLRQHLTDPAPNIQVPELRRRQVQPRSWLGPEGRLTEFGLRLLAASGDRDKSGIPLGFGANFGTAGIGMLDNEYKLRAEQRKDADNEIEDLKSGYNMRLNREKLLEAHEVKRGSAANQIHLQGQRMDQKAQELDERIRNNQAKEKIAIDNMMRKFETDAARMGLTKEIADAKDKTANRGIDSRERIAGDRTASQERIAADKDKTANRRIDVTEAGVWDRKPGSQTDENGNVVEGTWYHNNRTNQSVFRPERITSLGGRGQSDRLVILNDLKNEAAQRGITLSTEDALRIMRNPGVDSVTVRALEITAAGNARARLREDQKAAENTGRRLPANHFDKLVAEERRRYNLAPAQNQPSEPPMGTGTVTPQTGNRAPKEGDDKITRYLKTLPKSPDKLWYERRGLNPADYKHIWE